mmetsp:Transcript_114603/g.335135  ORF Transcript_114603/g.335135 Transcript_114603/m.335135 type:complete len:260 (+) Transcript_114603:490-1269(+)
MACVLCHRSGLYITRSPRARSGLTEAAEESAHAPLSPATHLLVFVELSSGIISSDPPVSFATMSISASGRKTRTHGNSRGRSLVLPVLLIRTESFSGMLPRPARSRCQTYGCWCGQMPCSASPPIRTLCAPSSCAARPPSGLSPCSTKSAKAAASIQVLRESTQTWPRFHSLVPLSNGLPLSTSSSSPGNSSVIAARNIRTASRGSAFRTTMKPRRSNSASASSLRRFGGRLIRESSVRCERCPWRTTLARRNPPPRQL